MMGVALIGIILLQNFGEALTVWITALVMLVFGILSIRLLLIKPVEKVLVDLAGINQSQPGIIIFGGLSIISIILSLIIVEHRMGLFISGVMFLIFAAYTTIYKLKAQHLITETGYFQGLGEVKWEQIENYMWAKSHEEKTILVFQTKSRWWPSFLSYRDITIPTKYKNRVEYIFSKYVNALQVQVG
jgi:hypothetical protein